jgi:hypothetical protein
VRNGGLTYWTHVYGVRAFGAAGYLELHLLTFLEHHLVQNIVLVEEDLSSVLLGDEAVPPLPIDYL